MEVQAIGDAYWMGFFVGGVCGVAMSWLTLTAVVVFGKDRGEFEP